MTPDGPGVPRVVRRRRVPPPAGKVPRRWHPHDIVDSYLVPDERVVMSETRSLRAFLLAQAPWLVLAVVAVGAVASLDQPLLTRLAVLAVLALAVHLVLEGLKAWYTRYVLTDLRVLRVSGVLNRNAEFIPWGKVTDITRRESMLQWLAGTATIRIESANERSGFRAIDDVEDPDRFYQALVEMVDHKQGRVRRADLPGRR